MTQHIQKFKLFSSTGFEVEILNYGAIVTKILAADRNGFRSNIVLSYDKTEDYLDNPLYLGCIVGPVAGRTQSGLIKIDEKIIQLDTQSHPNALHSGAAGLHKVYWQIHAVGSNSITLTHTALAAGETQCYTLTYTVEDESLHMDYHVTSTDKTYLSLTNHSYFNLTGSSNTQITDHVLKLNCSHYAKLDAESLPTALVPVKTEDLDFTKVGPISNLINNQHPDITTVSGIDHPFKCTKEQPAIVLSEPNSGRCMTVTTTQPYVVIYTGNFLDTAVHASGQTFGKHTGICFETQDLPNITNHPLDHYTLTTPERPYSHRTTFSFSIA